jgi:hypothetical protein
MSPPRPSLAGCFARKRLYDQITDDNMLADPRGKRRQLIQSRNVRAGRAVPALAQRVDGSLAGALIPLANRNPEGA